MTGLHRSLHTPFFVYIIGLRVEELQDVYMYWSSNPTKKCPVYQTQGIACLCWSLITLTLTSQDSS